MITLDIETVPTVAAMAVPFDRATAKAPANYKSDEAIQKWLDSAAADYTVSRAKECSINPRLGRVLCIGLATVEHGPEMLYAESEGEGEAEILRAFWDRFRLHAEPLVTWNGAWDLRFLAVRSLRHRIQPPLALAPYFKKYDTLRHFDAKAVLMQDWAFRGAGEGLDEWSQFFGLAGKSEGWSGASVYPAYLAGRHQEIASYCAADVAATTAIYNLIRDAF